MENIKNKIENMISKDEVVLFMKGTSSMPQCGFSSKVAGVLNYLDINFQDINVLEDEEIRQGIKDYSEWPTIPQLYIKGEFVGGCDIITEMVLNSEFDQLLNDKGINFSASKANEVRDANS